MAFANANPFSTSSSTSTTPPTMANSITHINPSLLLLSNMSSMMIVKLDYSNCIVWKHQIEKIKKICDKLAAISVILDDEDLLHVALDGLSSEYDSFSSTIRTHSDVFTVEELNTLLNAKERAIKKRFGVFDGTTMAMVANYQPQGFGRDRARNNNKRSSGNGGRGTSSSLVVAIVLMNGLCLSRQACSIQTCCYGG
ncbi:hypothetical protein SO802_009214 [Lithocarpus litseifolius]|uniref:Uncharacterized protein n=1 Tax=Lithocarpus litseifolius TaxID=425828 RepID=A0AAW2DCY3_9ROSI